MQLSGADTGALSTRPAITVAGQPLPWVRDFVYLGVPFHESEDLDTLMAEERLLKARRAQAALRHRCARLGITNPAMQANFFDIIVRSTMSYGVELWGPGYLATTAAKQGTDGAEVLHREFLRRLLGVRKNAHNLITYSEFGRLPLRCFFSRMAYQFYKRVVGVAALGHKGILTAAVNDNLKLAATQSAAGVVVQQQAWAGKAAAFLDGLGIEVDLEGAPAAPEVAPLTIEATLQ